LLLQQARLLSGPAVQARRQELLQQALAIAQAQDAEALALAAVEAMKAA
jgi:hypothetical protein